MLPYRRKSERICVSSSCQLLLCIRGHLHPKPTLLFYKSCIEELGCSSPPDRVLQVMAKLPSWHCPIKTYWCVPVPESSSPHCRAKWTCPASPGNGRGDRARSPKASAWQAAQGMEVAAVQHTHGTSRHAHQTCCRAGVMILNKYKAGIRLKSRVP